MTSLERVVTAMEHRVPDRVPSDLGSTFVTGMARIAWENLLRHRGQEPGGPRFADVLQQLVVLDEELLQEWEVDVRGLIPHVVRANPALEVAGDGEERFTDEWGVSWKRPPDALYFDLSESPLAGEIGEADIRDHPWPDPADPALLEGLAEQAQAYAAQGRAVILESICAGVFEMSCRIRGYEAFYADLAVNPGLAAALMDRIVEVKIGFYEAAARRLDGLVQFIRDGDDVAGQESLLISPAYYRRYLKPRHRSLLQEQKRLFRQPFFSFFHSDGAIYELLPDLVEIGVDVLNPVQVSNPGVGLERLKREFGRRLSFWGGGVDTQAVFPRGTPEQVKADVRRRVRILGEGGGYLFGCIHDIQADVPPENIVAMWEAFQEVRAASSS